MKTSHLNELYKILSKAIINNPDQEELSFEYLRKKVQEENKDIYKAWEKCNFDLNVRDDSNKTILRHAIQDTIDTHKILQYAIQDTDTFAKLTESVERCEGVLSWLKKHKYEVEISDVKCISAYINEYSCSAFKNLDGFLGDLYDNFNVDYFEGQWPDLEEYFRGTDGREPLYPQEMKMLTGFRDILLDGVKKGQKEFLLHKAVEKGNAGAVQFLLEEGRDPYEKNSDGKTAIEIAEEQGDRVIINLLKAPSTQLDSTNKLAAKSAGQSVS